MKYPLYLISQLLESRERFNVLFPGKSLDGGPNKVNQSINEHRLAFPIYGNHQMIMNLKGKIKLVNIYPGTLVWMPEGTWNHPTWGKPVMTMTTMFNRNYLRINFKCELIKNELPNFLSILWEPLPNSNLELMIRLIDKELENEKILKFILPAFLHELGRLSDPEEIGGKAYRTWRSINAYIEEHAMEEITRSSVAAYFDITPEHLSHLFKKYGEFNFSDTLNHKRLNDAKSLIERTNHTIAEIANRCGFESPNYFARVFRKKFGLSPSKVMK